MFAALDETYPSLPGGTAYVLAAAVLGAERDDVRQAARDVIAQPGRMRPFHWHEEGPLALDRMVDCLQQVGAVAVVCVHRPTAGNQMDRARAAALETLIPPLIAEGISELLIEARGPKEDRRDQATILDTFNALEQPGAFAYGWHSKAEPIVWFADAICGAVRAHLTKPASAPHFDRLQAAGVIDQLTFISGA